jgi:hypothetical protein
MTDSLGFTPTRLWGVVIVLLLAASDYVICSLVAYGRFAEHWKMMLPTFGAAVIVQALSMLAFLASAIRTDKFSTITFVWWQILFVAFCTTYVLTHGSSSAGLWVGSVWSACLASNVWASLHYRIKAEMRKKMAATADTIARGLSRLRIDDRDDALEKGNWTLDDSSSSETEGIVSRPEWLTQFAMLFYFSAGIIGFVFAYLTGTLKNALSTFGLGFMGMIIVTLVLLNFARSFEAHRLALRLKNANVVLSVISLVVGIVIWRKDGVYNFGVMSVMHWAACLNAGIAEVLLQSSPDKDSGEEEHDSEDSDEQ